MAKAHDHDEQSEEESDSEDDNDDDSDYIDADEGGGHESEDEEEINASSSDGESDPASEEDSDVSNEDDNDYTDDGDDDDEEEGQESEDDEGRNDRYLSSSNGASNESSQSSFSRSKDGSTTEDGNDTSEVGDAELSSDSSDDNFVFKRREIKNATKNRCAIEDDDDSDAMKEIGTVDDESDSDVSENKKEPSKGEILPSPMIEETLKRRLSRSIFPKCPSSKDAITLEKLPRLHVCYITPDGKTRICFNLETLRRVALYSKELNLRVDYDAVRKNFLQPPAFRSAMSDEMVMQIASKFGREALDLQGEYYRKRGIKNDQKNYDENSHELNDDDDEQNESSHDSNNSDSESEQSSGHSHDINRSGSTNEDACSSDSEDIYESFQRFQKRFGKYFNGRMGSQDLYVCPLCYGCIHRTVANENKEEEEEEGEQESGEEKKDDDEENGNSDEDEATQEYNAAPSDSEYDPMIVLGYLDNDEMSMASQFCFKTLREVRRHLRQEHDVCIEGIEGNDLYQRFKVRAQDGLLQRWLKNARRQVKHGHMLGYWEGRNSQIHIRNSQIYIDLLDLVERSRAYAKLSQSSEEGSSQSTDDSDEYAAYQKKVLQAFLESFAPKVIGARQFFASFSSKASKWWEIIASPYLKESKDTDDFIANDDENEDSGIKSEEQQAVLCRQLMRQDMEENSFLQDLEKKYANASDGEHDSSVSASTSEIAVDSNDENDSNDDDDEEEEEVEEKEEEEEAKDDDDDDDDGEDDEDEDTDEDDDEEEPDSDDDSWVKSKQETPKKRKLSSAMSTSRWTRSPKGKKMLQRKMSTPSGLSSPKPSASKRRRIRTLDDSSSEED